VTCIEPVTPSSPRPVRLSEQNQDLGDELTEIVSGLDRSPKSLPPKFFYDERGSALFEAICNLPEYYLTRTELQIMRENIDAIAESIGPGACVIEFGSGSSLKTRILLEHLYQISASMPVDISREHLAAAAAALARDFPAVEVLPVVADFMQPFELPSPRRPARRNVVYFPGSTIGNFTPDAAHQLLRVMHHEAGPGGALLIGADLKKDPAILHRAYNDDSGITAAFNLNMLRRLNREFGADFNLADFAHRAVWNEASGRIEMHLVSRRKQTVCVAGRDFPLRAGEFIVTEHSHKYSLTEFRVMVQRAGFQAVEVWTDARDWFSVQLFLRR
jgi:dimethylhistidine N-methyltransferase